MYVKELEEGDLEGGGEKLVLALSVPHHELRFSDAKRVLIGASARALFYPTLLYNVLRNKIQSEFRWWDEVDEFVLLGAVPFPNDVPRLKQLGVQGVITLNELYETLVPTSLYLAYGIDHLVIPTRDYLFAPSFVDICQAVDFIHKKASCGKTTYVHCKAGRGRSTTIVLCYLVKHKQMTPFAAYQYVRSTRPRVLLAASQWQLLEDNIQAVEDYYRLTMRRIRMSNCSENPVVGCCTPLKPIPMVGPVFDDGSIVVVTESDLDGYDGAGIEDGRDLWAELSFVYRVQFAGQAALARLSCLWIGCHRPKIAAKKLSMARASLLNGTDEGLGN